MSSAYCSLCDMIAGHRKGCPEFKPRGEAVIGVRVPANQAGDVAATIQEALDGSIWDGLQVERIG